MSDLKNLFTFELPYIGRVSMLFYIPECNERDMLESIIEKHGGRLTKFHECYTYQINPIYNEICARDFFIGNVYRATWLTDSIKAGEMLDNEEYLQKVVTESEKGVMRLKTPKSFNYMFYLFELWGQLGFIGVRRDNACIMFISCLLNEQQLTKQRNWGWKFPVKTYDKYSLFKEVS